MSYDPSEDPMMEELDANRRDEKGRKQPVELPDEPGRNDECPCGSGKKYKQCCLKARKKKDQHKTLVDRVMHGIEKVAQDRNVDKDRRLGSLRVLAGNLKSRLKQLEREVEAEESDE